MHSQPAICPDKKQALCLPPRIVLFTALLRDWFSSQQFKALPCSSVLQMPAVTSRSRPWLPQPCQICLHTLRVEQRIRLFPWKGPHHQCWAPTSPILLTRETVSPSSSLAGSGLLGPLSPWWLVSYRLTLQPRERKEDGRMECWKGKGNALS